MKKPPKNVFFCTVMTLATANPPRILSRLGVKPENLSAALGLLDSLHANF